MSPREIFEAPASAAEDPEMSPREFVEAPASAAEDPRCLPEKFRKPLERSCVPAGDISLRLALLTIRFAFQMQTDSSTWALLAIILRSIVLTNSTCLALDTKVLAVLMNALVSESTLEAAWFVVFAETSPATMRAAPLEAVMRAIW